MVTKRIVRKGAIFLFICCCLCCLVLAGCIGEDVAIKINSDGSGQAVITYGITKQGIEMLVEQNIDKKIISELKEVNIEGNTQYYGKSDSYEFNNIEEFNELFGRNFMMDYGVATLSLSKIDENYLCLVLNIQKNYQNFEQILLSLYPDLSDSDLVNLKAYMSFLLDITLPGNIYSLNNESIRNVNITAKGCSLKVDFRRLYDTQKETEKEYKFLITTNPNIYFSDVSDDYWGRNAIYSLAYGGLVQGIGNNIFNPNSSITRGEFYTILARAVGLNTDSANGYWASGAISSCGNAKLIVNWEKYNENGFLNESDWTVPILREEAVSAVYLAYDLGKRDISTYTRKLSSTDIPDFSKISPDYSENVLKAYNYKIIDGIDNKYTFNPKGHLKRVEVCQLFYNIGWFSPLTQS